MSEAFDFESLRVETEGSNEFADFMQPDIGDPDFMVDAADIPDASLLEEKQQTPRSKRYQKKANVPFRLATKKLMQHPETLPDAATFMLYAPKLTRAVGDLADENERFRNAIDMLSDTVENPYAAIFASTIPFALQILRNHEPDAETMHHGIPIWKGKRILTRFTFRIKVGWLRAATYEPSAITQYVFTNPQIVSVLSKQGMVKVENEQPAKATPRKRAPRKAAAK